jgi:glycosyltransferase involved in cell wall biosynthesis
MLRILAVTNMYPTATHPTSGTFVEQQVNGLRQVGLITEVLLIDRLNSGMKGYLALARRLRAAIATFKPDIVHCMYGGVMSGFVTGVVRDRAVVVSFCGDDLLGELLSGPVRRLVSRYGIVCSHRAARRADGIVVKSRNLRQALPDDVPHDKVRIIANGIDLDRFRPLDAAWCRSQLGWSADRLNVLFPTNTGDPRKRPQLARDAVKAAEQYGLKLEMHSLEGVQHDRVPLWLNASDVVMLTSLHEGSPNIVKEALACNVPVVSVDVGDVRERIEGIAGCHIASADPADLAMKLREVHDGSRRVRSRSTVEHLSLTHVARQLRGFYEEILDARRTREASRSNEKCVPSF